MRTGQIASVLAVLGAACVGTKTQQCEDGRLCPANLACHAVPDSDQTVCVTTNQLAACGDALDRTACVLGEGTGSLVGTCFGGACFPAVCGDNIVDVTEACDLGDRLPGDGCSANCLSREVCGDERIDLALGEQCDEGRTGLSGDGCSSSCINEFDLWRDLTPRPPGARSDASVAPAPGGGVMVFGGTPGVGTASPSTALADAWRWDGVSWGQLVSATESPPARANAAAAYDPKSRSFLVFGGKGADGAALNDLWRWDGVAWKTLSSSTAPPPARWNASMACSNLRCVVHGGRISGGVLGDTWVWNGTSWNALTGSQPPARSHGALGGDPSADSFVLFGGFDVGARQDTWELTTQWTQKMTLRYPPAVVHPAGTYEPTTASMLVVAGTETWMFKNGDWTNTGFATSLLSPKLAFDVTRGIVAAVGPSSAVVERAGNEWTPAPDQKPGAQALALLSAYDPRRGRTLVVEPGATWEWDARGWRRVTTKPLVALHPSPVNAGIVFDTACDRAVLYGGGVGAAAVDHTWTFNGTWTRQTFGGPAARSLHAITYDAKRDVVVVFGGLGATNQPLRDVWELRGPCAARAWVQIPTLSGPSPRTSARLAFDAKRGVSVLYGGTAAGAMLDDTWEWDGTAWTSQSPMTKPSARKDAALGYDPRRGSIVMFGGGNGASLYADTWRWDGTDWKLLAPVNSPPGRQAMALAPDNTGRLVIFGGESETPGNLVDVWRLGSETANGAVERCGAEGVDADGDGLKTCADPDCGPRCAPLCPYGTSCTGPTCGDGACSPVEDYMLCPADCMAP